MANIVTKPWGILIRDCDGVEWWHADEDGHLVRFYTEEGAKQYAGDLQRQFPTSAFCKPQVIA